MVFPISLFLDDVISPERVSFHRPFYENVGYTRFTKDGKAYFVVNVVGIDESDLSVKVENAQINQWQNIVVSGKTHNELLNEDFSFRQMFLVKSPMRKITKTLKNGLLTLEVEFDKPVQPNVEIVNK